MIVVFLTVIEVVSRDRFDSSRVQRREVSQRRTLLAVHDNGTNTDPHIAFLGNSLMLEGVDMPLVKATLNPRYVPVPYFVLGTNYYDWFFGLRRLFAEGMRPEYVVLGLSPDQLASSDLRGDITARYMVQQADLLDVVRQTHMNATRGSEFILAHYSEFYSTRDITRGYVMRRVLPNVGELLHGRYASVRDPDISTPVLKQVAAIRLEALDNLCRSNGAHLLFVVPPTYQKGAETILDVGKERGISVFVPVKDDEFDLSDFQSDGIHMNEKGSHIFTERLMESLNEGLPKRTLRTAPSAGEPVQ
jgi:hypothetical protein